MAESNIMDKTGVLIEQLGKAFLDLESHKVAAEDKVFWKEIEEHFCQLQTTMVKQLSELESKEKAFKEEESEFYSFLEAREANVAAKEQDMMDRVQELKNEAVAAIEEVRATHPSASLESMDVGYNKEIKVSSPSGDKNAIFTSHEVPHKTVESDGVVGEIELRHELTQFCEQMNAKGLLSFIVENKKLLPCIRNELSVALESASEPSRLVLASLEGFFPSDPKTQEGNKKDAVFQGMRQSCLVILDAMATLLAKAGPRVDHLLNPEIKQRAKAIAHKWKPNMANAGIHAANGNSLEAEAFLQLLAIFRIASEFDDEELCKLVLVVAQKRQLPELCRSLGLAHKMPGVVESLVNSGKQIDAVHLAHAFQLTESFPLVPLLQTYLKDLRRNSQGKKGGAGGGQKDANAQELAALKVVIKCVHDYNLEADYPLDPLHRRVAQLEKAKPDKKRFGESGKNQQSKKPRTNGGFHAPPAAATVVSRQAPAYTGERAYAGIAERFPRAVPDPYTYQAPTQSSYGQPGYDHRSYYYPHGERVAAPTYTAYNTAPPSYASYPSSGLPTSHPSYI
ncbi:FRIGIDA-like protein 3 [Apium graveolens]|uniref:FRIGIDA-like protein 3 n=1 Tax=Apium graveolens TaxID=4045 RepID=UPI003D7ABED8